MGCSASVYTNETENQSPNGHAAQSTEEAQLEKTVTSSSSDQTTSTSSPSPPPLIYGLRPPMKGALTLQLNIMFRVLTLRFTSSEVKAPIAFEVPGQDGEDHNAERVSIIQTHPPKRLRRLEDDQINISTDELARRQALAEKRRSEVRLRINLHQVHNCKLF